MIVAIMMTIMHLMIMMMLTVIVTKETSMMKRCLKDSRRMMEGRCFAAHRLFFLGGSPDTLAELSDQSFMLLRPFSSSS